MPWEKQSWTTCTVRAFLRWRPQKKCSMDAGSIHGSISGQRGADWPSEHVPRSPPGPPLRPCLPVSAYLSGQGHLTNISRRFFGAKLPDWPTEEALPFLPTLVLSSWSFLFMVISAPVHSVCGPHDHLSGAISRPSKSQTSSFSFLPVLIILGCRGAPWGKPLLTALSFNT